MRLIILLTIVTCFFLSCFNTKYAYHFEKGKSLDFSDGKWAINKPYTDKNIKHLEDIALKEFRVIIKDSLFKIEDLRSSAIIESNLPYILKTSNLDNLKIGTKVDYIINYKVDILKDQLNSLSTVPPIGTVIKTNEVLVEISIYDIKKLELLSRSSIVGKAKLEINEDDSGWDISETPNVISRKALTRLIKQYRKNKK